MNTIGPDTADQLAARAKAAGVNTAALATILEMPEVSQLDPGPGRRKMAEASPEAAARLGAILTEREQLFDRLVAAYRRLLVSNPEGYLRVHRRESIE
ncbi:hypothetical protein [Nocardia sp. NPDC004711]